MEEEQGFGGLGFSSVEPNHVNNGIGESSAGDAAGDMLKQLMQQCLDYHTQQQHPRGSAINDEKSKKYDHDDLHQHLPSSGVQTQLEGPFGFKAGGEERMDALSSNVTEVGVPHTITVNHEQHRPQRDVLEIAEEGRSRANAILAKFQELTRVHGVVANEDETLTTAPSEFREKRERFFEKENQRKHRFLLKNLEYVGKRQEQRLQQQLSQLNEAQQYESQIQDHYQQVLEERKKRLMGGKTRKSEAGIGTAKRKRVEKEKYREGHVPISSNSQDTSAAIYLSGLPTSGSSPQENTLTQLFSSYGSIRKIHIYRDKQTGHLKGDALVIYQVKPAQKDEILQTVCEQMNGAELPCGSVLRVEPAHSNYPQKQRESSQYGPAAGIDSSSAKDKEAKLTDANNSVGLQNTGCIPAEDGMDEGDATGDDDLDDFFESLAD